ncbi:carbamoyl-phosphate synthase large subunit [Metallibacterium sp.]|uniref:carbamoyl-phosphate synthase large subunit n=1 Tax=Metallibacterium sp. TaxID=2940281 RepID=UPI00261F5143|nr:carbamoyl-phosphate synthase large subunit [Metallibacterium sp.]
MGRRDDLSSILVVGSGPIVIGQACEFDYSGTQACRVLSAEGYRVILANSNPATIMTDPNLTDRTYVEPLDAEVLAAILERERPSALLPTMGGQTALNLAAELSGSGVLDELGVELIGAKAEAIHTAENRDLFKRAMTEIGLGVPSSGFAHTVEQAVEIAREIGYPIMVRPSFILGGAGTGIAKDETAFLRLAGEGLAASPVSEILVERSIAGWKEFELEVMRDRADNCVVVCSIENLDPMGVHTGDSVTVAPAQTLSDVEYQEMRDAAFKCIRRVGVETGGSNIQFAVDPRSGEMLVIEMNPRVSRSSALASKATGFPIAKIAARLAVGYTLDEVANDITRATPASFEPTIDYVVTKIPRWAFEKLPGAPDSLGTRMQSVGEAMAIGRTFCESLQKAVRSLEQGRAGLNADPQETAIEGLSDDELLRRISVATPDRIFEVECALRRGLGVDALRAASGIDPWFLRQIARLADARRGLPGTLDAMDRPAWRRMKQLGFSDAQLAYLLGSSEAEARAARRAAGVEATFKTVDTCGAEFEAFTPYHYSTYEDEDEVRPTGRDRVIILGSGPNRIGQGIEFDYCCVHAALALREDGFETIMVNCNPETVSTDYDTSDRLYFEPLTLEDVLEIVELEKPVGVIVQYGGQTPLKLAQALEANGVPVIGTSPDSIDLAEDRERFQKLVTELGLLQPRNRTARNADEALLLAREIGYPLVVRPSYVLGGRAMEVVYSDADLARYIRDAVRVSERSPVLLDRFLDNAIEVDVDVVADADGNVLVGGIMEHIEEAGVHSGDSSCSLPPYSLSPAVQAQLRTQVTQLARALKVNGLMNTQFAVQGETIYILEVNPRASRTVPFVSKASGVALAKIAARCMAGRSLVEQDTTREVVPGYYSVKEAIFPFAKFQNVDPILGPEMRSTGEVMGVGRSFGAAFARAHEAAGIKAPPLGKAFLSVRDADKERLLPVALDLLRRGYGLVASGGTAAFLSGHGVVCERINKVLEGRPHIVDLIKNGEIVFIVNTTEGKQAIADSFSIRREALQLRITYSTTIAGARALLHSLDFRGQGEVLSLQELHQELHA